MRNIRLVRSAPPDYFQQPIIELANFLRRGIPGVNLWNFVADFLREVTREDTPETRKRMFNELSFRYFLKSGATRARFKMLLFRVYDLELDEDPRGRLLEYVVYITIPHRSQITELSRSEYECTVHETAAGGSSRPLVQSRASFDAGFLSEICFEGYECKLNIWNFLSDRGQLSARGRRKLNFMQSIGNVVMARGGVRHLFLVGVRREHSLHGFLAGAGFDEIVILGPDEIQTQLAA